jgi:hypothetical protein
MVLLMAAQKAGEVPLAAVDAGATPARIKKKIVVPAVAHRRWEWMLAPPTRNGKKIAAPVAAQKVGAAVAVGENMAAPVGVEK